MGTTIRPVVSEKNPYWIERHRYYELKHFCLQYPLWKKAYAAFDGLGARPANVTPVLKTPGDPTAKCVEAREFYFDRVKMLERVALATDESLSSYILRGVTQGLSYDYLKVRLDIPCCKDSYYSAYRRFFWLLDRERQ